MHTDARKLDAGKEITVDICIVGAGAAGITIAREFLGRPTTVCLLESGGFQLDPQAQRLCEIEDVGPLRYPHMTTPTSRVRQFGGTTSLWGGMARPFDAIDFEQRSWIPYSGWPVDLKTLGPFYRRAQSVCQISTYRYEDLDFWEDAESGRSRLPLNGDFETKIYQYSPPTRFGVEYRRELIESRNIHVLTHANAAELTTTDERSVDGARILMPGGKSLLVKSRVVVLAAGAIENARILLLSDSVSPSGLGNDHDTVGRFFTEHPHLFTGTIHPLGKEQTLYLYGHFTRDDKRARGLLHLRESVQRVRHLQNLAFALYPVQQTGVRALRDIVRTLRGDGQYSLRESISWLLSDATGTVRSITDRLLGRTRLTYDPQKFFSFRKPMRLYLKLDQRPNPESRVSLSDQLDALGQRKARLSWRLTDDDRLNVQEATMLLADSFERAGIAETEVYDWVLDNAAGWPDDLEVHGHHMGTTRMGTDPASSVVDQHCRVHGIRNLYVAGSSVFPTGGCVNPTLTIVALALRLSDHLREFGRVDHRDGTSIRSVNHAVPNPRPSDHN